MKAIGLAQKWEQLLVPVWENLMAQKRELAKGSEMEFAMAAKSASARLNITANIV